MKPYVITIARQYGSGGKTVGRMLAKELSVPFYDREIIALASEDSGINPVLFGDEQLKPDLMTRLRSRRDRDTSLQNEGGKSHLTDEELFSYQAKTISRLAEQGPCIIMGRCADYVLRERTDVVRLFVHADDAFCLEQAMKVNSMDEENVRKKIAGVDEMRAKYYKHHTGHDWYDARNYDLSLNSGVLGFEGTLQEILRYLEERSALEQA